MVGYQIGLNGKKLVILLDNLIITEQEQNINHQKWNTLVNHNIALENILKQIIGINYKGAYDPLKTYSQGDYLLINNQLCVVDNKSTATGKTFTLERIYKNAIIVDNAIYFINQQNFLEKKISNVSYVNSEQTIDKFKMNQDKVIIANKGTRFYKMINNKMIPLNITFGTQIIDYAVDKFYIYFISENKIRYGNIYNNENTFFQEIDIPFNPIKIEVTDDYIFILNEKSELIIINKKDFKYVSYQLDKINVNIQNVKILPISNKFVSIYDGINHIISFSINDNAISIFNVKEIPYNSKLENCQNTFSISNKNQITQILNLPFLYRPIDVSKILVNNSVVTSSDYYLAMDFAKGHILQKEFTPNVNTGTLLENQGIYLEKNSQLVYEKFNNLNNKTLIIDFHISDTFHNDNIGYFLSNGIKIIFKNYSLKGNIKLIINFKELSSEIFVYNENKLVKNIIENNNKVSHYNQLAFVNEGLLIKQFIVTNSIISREFIELYGKNKINISDCCENNSKPFSYIKSNKDGNTIIQTGTNNQKGILFISDDATNVNNQTALSTIGAKKIMDQLKNIVEKIKTFADKGHKHKFSELLEIPTATHEQKGIVFLSSSIVNDSSKAANSADLKKVYDLANHEHPYLNINNNGILNGKIDFNNTASFKKPTNFTDINSNNINTGILKVSERFNTPNASVDNLNVTSNAEINKANIRELKINGYKITVG